MILNVRSTTNVYRLIHARGFTFVEFIVIISIFGIMASVALFNFQGFRSSVALNNLVYDIALEIKTAQTLGVSAPGSDINNAGQVITTLFAYDGVVFANAFTTYREIDNQGLGDFDQNDEVLRQASLQGGTIQSLSWCPPGLNTTCSPFSSDVYISFRRPDPEPVITSTSVCSGNSPSGFQYPTCENGSLQIAVAAQNNSAKIQYIYVEQTGQIRVADQ